MIFLPLDIREKLLATNRYTETSINTMDGQIMRIHKLLFLTHFDIETLKNLSIIKPLFELHFDKSSVTKNIANTIIRILEIVTTDNLDEWKKWHKIITHAHYDNYHYKELTETELSNLISMKDVHDLFIKYQTDIINKKCKKKFVWIKYLILAVYSLHPPLRGQDWYGTKIVNIKNDDKLLENYNIVLDKDKHNIYNIVTGELVLKFYKTTKSYGLRILTLSDELQAIIKNWMTINRTQFLFPTLKTGLAMTQQSFTQRLNTIFSPKKVSTSMIRKVYISETIPSMTVTQRKELSKIMAHSLVMQEFVYKKF
jgi:hypothetical protein